MFERVLKFWGSKEKINKPFEKVKIAVDEETEDNDYSENLEILLGILKEEFEREQNRAEKLDNRIGILLAACVAILSFILQNFKVSGLLLITTGIVIKINVLPLLLTLSSIFFIIWSCVLLIKIISPKPYNSIDYNMMLNYRNQSKVVLNAEIIKGYNHALEVNSNINDDKMKKYIKSIHFIFTSLILFSISFVIMAFMTT